MFLVCGDALIDIASHGDAPSALSLVGRVGGSAFQVASALARHGQRAAFLGGVSLDAMGDRVVAALRAEGVDTTMAMRLEAPTALRMVSAAPSGERVCAFHGHGAADRLLPRLAIQRSLPPGCTAIHLGSYTAVVEPVASTLRKLIERECGNVFVAFEADVQLGAEPDLQRWRDVLDWAASHVDMLTVRDEELRLLYPGSAPQALTKAWLARGVSLVVVATGPGAITGVEAWTARQRARANTSAASASNFHAGLLAALARRNQLQARTLHGASAAELRSWLRACAPDHATRRLPPVLSSPRSASLNEATAPWGWGSGR